MLKMEGTGEEWKRDMRKKRSETRCWTGRKRRKNGDAGEGDTENGRRGKWRAQE